MALVSQGEPHPAARLKAFLLHHQAHTVCMFQWLWSFVDWLKGLFYNEEMEVTLVGLQNSGKTTLVNVLAVLVALTCFGC